MSNFENIEDVVSSIKTKEDFLVFMQILVVDSKDNINDWTNKTVPSYLESMEGWIESMEGYYINNKISNVDLTKVNWRVFADILLSAKYYE